MGRYVEVPFALFDERLRAAGFASAPSAGWMETVYERAVEGRTTAIRVFSGYLGGVQRRRGSDAVRVVLVHRWRDGVRERVRGVRSYARVHRSGTAEGVVERVLERARTAWRDARLLGPATCAGCGGPRWAESGACFFRCGRPVEAVASGT